MLIFVVWNFAYRFIIGKRKTVNRGTAQEINKLPKRYHKKVSIG